MTAIRVYGAEGANWWNPTDVGATTKEYFEDGFGTITAGRSNNIVKIGCVRNDKLPVSFRDVTGEHHCLGRGTQNANAVFGCSNAGVFILRAHDVIGVVGFEVGSEFFVQRLRRVFGCRPR